MAEDSMKTAASLPGKIRNVAPTIVIGLGGTGKEVLLRLRRRFYERYNTFGFPIIGYLWIDTDTRNHNIDDQPLDHIMEQVMFNEEERVSAEVPGAAFAGYFSDQRTSPHIFSWLDQKLSVLGQVVNGAGQVRPLGRLAFFHSYKDIRSKFDKAAAKVRLQSAVEEMREKYKITVDGGRLDIIVICSLAGGTGSGMFLDATFMCRQVLPSSDITGYLVLPPVFAESIKGNEKIYANAYAALKELEYYSLRKDVLSQDSGNNAGTARLAEFSRHDFVADWENRKHNAGIELEPIQPPPFNTCYLLDNQTHFGSRGRIGPQDKSYLCDMVAENIFLNFSSEEFSRTKDSVRANLEQYLGNPLVYNYGSRSQKGTYSEVYAQRFSSFGFSKLYVPVDRIRRACGYQLGLDLIDRWLKRNEMSEVDIERSLETRELADLGLRTGSVGDDVIAELRRVGERTFDDDIRDEVNRWRETLLKRINTEKRPGLYDAIPRLLREFLDKNFDKSDRRPENWGAYIKTLEQNRARFIRLVCGEFDQNGNRKPGADGRILGQVKSWLNNDYVRLYLAIEYLKMTGKILDRNIQQFYLPAKESADHKATAAAEDIKIKLEMVRDEESGFIVQRASLRVLVEQICDRLREHLSARMNVQILIAATDVINNQIKPYIGKEEIREDARGQKVTERAGLILELWTLRDELTWLHSRLKSRLESFEKVQEHLIYENLYQHGMFKNYYRIQRPEGYYPVPAKIEELESLLLQRLGKNNPHDFRDLIDKLGREKVLNTIEDFCYLEFQELEITADVTDLFVQIFQSKTERDDRLKRLVENGSVRLPPSEQAGIAGQLTSNIANSVLISVNPEKREKYGEVYSGIESQLRAAGYNNPSYPTSNRGDAIFLYTEYAGIPLAYIREIDRYFQDAYLPLVRKGISLHIDSHDEKFTDFLIKRMDEIDVILQANRALLIGTLLRVVKVTTDSAGVASFSFASYQDGMPNTELLGAKAVAIETLKNRPDLLVKIQREIDQRRLNLKNQPQESRLKFYTLLVYHLADKQNEAGLEPGPFARSQMMTSKGVEQIFSPEYVVLEETQKQVFEQLVHDYGSEESVIDKFNQYYKTMDNFSDVVVIDQRRIRFLKDGVYN